MRCLDTWHCLLKMHRQAPHALAMLGTLRTHKSIVHVMCCDRANRHTAAGLSADCVYSAPWCPCRCFSQTCYPLQVPDIYDSAKYDAIHNSELGLDIQELYKVRHILSAQQLKATLVLQLAWGGCIGTSTGSHSSARQYQRHWWLSGTPGICCPHGLYIVLSSTVGKTLPGTVLATCCPPELALLLRPLSSAPFACRRPRCWQMQ